MNGFMTLKDHVYEYISKKIQDGSLKSNDKINEKDISDELNISRTPIREALIHLAADGLLVSEPRRGFRVKPLTLKEATDLYQLIGHLDAMAASLSVENLTQEDILKMDQLTSEMYRSIEDGLYADYYKRQTEFHNVYINKCGNDELIHTLNLLRMRFIRQGYSSKNKDSLAQIFKLSCEQHKEIIRLFKEKDGDALTQYIKFVHWDMNYAELDVIE